MAADTFDYPAFNHFAQNISQRFSAIIHPIIDRIEPTSPLPEVSEAIASWRSARATLEDAINKKYRASEMAPLLSDVDSSALKLLHLVAKKSPLEVSADIVQADTIREEFAHKNAQFRLLYTSDRIIPNESSAEWEIPPNLETVNALKNSIEKLENRMTILNNSVAAGETHFASGIEPLQKKYADALAGLDAKTPELQAKSDQINDLLAFTSKKVLTGTYQDQANLEKTAADRLRVGALGIMGFALVLVAISFISSTREDHVLENTVLRLVFSLALAVPAAYMARESAKHRQQQYSLQQTALDVATIDPYINNLPEAIQHQIKLDVASKIFGARNFDHIGRDSFPLSTQEIITKLIDAMASRRSAEKPSDKSNDGPRG